MKIAKTEKKVTKRTVVTREHIQDAVAKSKVKVANSYATNLYKALTAYADEHGKKLTFGFIATIKPTESIRGIKETGFKVIACMQKDVAKLG